MKKAWEGRKSALVDGIVKAVYAMIPHAQVYEIDPETGQAKKDGPAADLFDPTETNRKRSELIDSLADQIADIGKKKKPPESYGNLGKYMDLATGQARPLVSQDQFGPLRKNAPKGWKPSKSAGPSVSADTSMLSVSDLFTMMQTGAGAKRETELSVLQAISGTLEKIEAKTGGVE